MNMNLIHTIVTAPWMMDPMSLEAYLPMVSNILNGGPYQIGDFAAPKPYTLQRRGGRNIAYREFEQAKKGSVAIHLINGVIFKQDKFCGPQGTETMMAMMEQADASPNIVAHVLSIDSPGGEGTNIETVASFIRNGLKKPVITHLNGYAASAAYYLGAAADEIYASQNTDKVGSIGAMIRVMDRSEYFEKKGIKIHDIYASQSSLKNNDFAEVRQGKYEKIQARLLDPLAQQFIDDIKAYRPEASDERIFKGDIFTAKEAIELKLVDGLLSFPEAIDRAIQLSKQQNSKSMDNIQTTLGHVAPLEIQDGGAFLSQEDLLKLETALSGKPVEFVDSQLITTLKNKLTAQGQNVQKLLTEVEGLKTEVANLKTQLGTKLSQSDFDAFKASAGDRPTEAFSAHNPEATPQKDEADNLDQNAYDAVLKGGIIFK